MKDSPRTAPPSARPSLALVMGLCLLLAGMTACANSPVTASFDGEMATPYHVQYDTAVQRQPPAVYVRPNISPNTVPTGLFVPLRIAQSMNNRHAVSRNLSRQIWQVWLSQQAFSALEYDDAVAPQRVEEALWQARRRGAQLLVGGAVTHLMDGGSVGDTSLSLHIEIYEVATGNLLWSMSQGGSIEKKQATDLFLVGFQARMPTDPLGVLTRALAHDMGLEVLYWVRPDMRKRGGPRGQAF